ncbi:MAG TPA: YihY/virulence factor BrkB family protein [Candidatus Saccharimonadales bacterium]|nr:YihY/virulence factor BrkB family protein [Candidatus Saccharimonadales bacterium]
MISIAPARKLVENFFNYYSNDRVGMLSAAFAYVTIFSIGPLLLVLISIVGLLLGQRAANGMLYPDLVNLFGPTTAHTIQNVLMHTHHTSDNVIALIIGIIGVIIGSIALTSQLQNSFNAIYDVGPDPKAGIKRTVYAKIKNFFLVLLAGLAITASIVATTLVFAIGAKAQAWLGTSGAVLEAFNSLGFWIIFTWIVYGLYRTLPDIVIPRKIAIIVALIISVLFLVGRLILGIAVGNNATISAYGAAASFVTLMLWAYYSGQILFVGAVGIKMYSDYRRLNFKPKRFNVRRTTIRVESDSTQGKVIEAWQRVHDRFHK